MLTKKILPIKSHFITHWIPLIIWLSFIFIVSSIHGSKFQILPFNTITQVHIAELLSYRQATFQIGEYYLLVILIILSFSITFYLLLPNNELTKDPKNLQIILLIDVTMVLILLIIMLVQNQEVLKL